MTIPVSERKTLLQFLFDLFRHPQAQADFARDPQGVLHAAGFGGVTPAELREVIPPVLEHCPPHLAAEWERMERGWGHHEWHPEHHHEPTPTPADHVCHPGCGCEQRHHDHDRDHDGWRDRDRDGWRDRDRDHDGWRDRDRDHDGWRDRDTDHDGWRGGDHDGWRGGDHDGWRGGDHDGWRGGDRGYGRGDGDGDDRGHGRDGDDRWNGHGGGHVCHPGCGCEQRHHDNDHDQRAEHHGTDHDYEVGKVLQQLHLIATDYGAQPQGNVFTGPVFKDAAYPVHHSIVNLHPSMPTHLNVGGFSHPAPVAHPDVSSPASFGAGHLPSPAAGPGLAAVPAPDPAAPTLGGPASTGAFGAGAPAPDPLPTTGHSGPMTGHSGPMTGHSGPMTGHSGPMTGHSGPTTGTPPHTDPVNGPDTPGAVSHGITSGIAEPAHAPVAPAPVEDPAHHVIHPIH